MAKTPVRVGFVAVAGAVVLASLCGSADAFVVAGGDGRVASSGRPVRAASSALTPSCCSTPPSSGRTANTVALRSPLTMRSAFRGRNPGREPASSWGLGSRQAKCAMRKGRGRKAAAQEVSTNGGVEAGGEREVEAKARGEERKGGAGGVVAARGRRFSRPAAVLRFVREAVEVGASKAGKGARARVAAWRRRMSVAMIGIAAAFIVMTASAGPAQALFGIPQRQQTIPKKLSADVPESVYLQRQNLQQFCATPQEDRLFDFHDLTVYEEELEDVNMFADNVAPSMATRESFRLKYIDHAEDFVEQEDGNRSNSIFAMTRFAALGALGLVAIGGVAGAFAWIVRAFLNMAREEEVFLYGEEISVDATEKEDEELDDLDDEDLDFDEGIEGNSAPPTSSSGDDPDPSPPSTPPSGGGGGFDAGDDGSADGDDLLGM